MLLKFRLSFDWAEALPPDCPPEDAIQPVGIFYRFVESVPTTKRCFLSQRALAPNKKFKGVSDCVARSLSIVKGVENAYQLQRLPTLKNKIMLKLYLTRQAGLVKRTFKRCGHYSWWRNRHFDIDAHAEVKK